jgi:glucose-6-phosphate 1-dehydrogenase
MALPACSIVIFGATGDLTKRKLIPALAKIPLAKSTEIVLIGRRADNAGLRNEFLAFTKDAKIAKRFRYIQMDFNKFDEYKNIEVKHDNRIFYLATGPESFPTITKYLERAGLASPKPARGWHRLVFEKPFGYDLQSAQKLNHELTQCFTEDQIYRIDHYLGKELVQNILVVRFSNPIFERLWNGRYVDNVQISVMEQHAVGSRGAYYDQSGALRDMVQNHLLQILSLIAMEAPTTAESGDVHDEKVKVLRQLRYVPDSLVLGQYAAGSISGKHVPDYKDEDGVGKRSRTETYAALALAIDNQRWMGTPFYLRTGKATGSSYAEVVMTFKRGSSLFHGKNGQPAPNKLILRIQPDEGMRLQFNLKGNDCCADPVLMDFSHKAEFGMNTPEAYERLLADVQRGDQTLFSRWDEVEHAWRIVDGLRKVHGKTGKLHAYRAGTSGPEEAKKLLARDGRSWHGQ